MAFASLSPVSPASLAGLSVSLIAAALIVGVVAARSPGGMRRAALVAVGGLAFQVVHVLEHGLQLWFWAIQPNQAAWLSPWASESAVGLAYWCSLVSLTGKPSLGVEMLHLLGNIIFLAALVAFWMVARQEPKKGWLKAALMVQTFHVAEHIALTGTLVAFNKTIGLSTGFGTVTGTNLVALRVIFHFGINAIATVCAIAAWREHGGLLTTARRRATTTNAPALASI